MLRFVEFLLDLTWLVTVGYLLSENFMPQVDISGQIQLLEASKTHNQSKALPVDTFQLYFLKKK